MGLIINWCRVTGIHLQNTQSMELGYTLLPFSISMLIYICNVFFSSYHQETNISWFKDDLNYSCIILYSRYDAEVHFVHESSDGKLAVIAILFKYGSPDPFLSEVFEVTVWVRVLYCLGSEKIPVFSQIIFFLVTFWTAAPPYKATWSKGRERVGDY